MACVDQTQALGDLGIPNSVCSQTPILSALKYANNFGLFLLTRTGSLQIMTTELTTDCVGAVPHIFAALARASLEMYNPASTANIRNAFNPRVLQRMSEESRWTLASSRTIVPDAALDDGKWEVGSVVNTRFLVDIVEYVEDERVRILLESMREAVEAAVNNLGEDGMVRTMDVWAGVFE